MGLVEWLTLNGRLDVMKLLPHVAEVRWIYRYMHTIFLEKRMQRSYLESERFSLWEKVITGLIIGLQTCGVSRSAHAEAQSQAHSFTFELVWRRKPLSQQL